MPQYVPTDLIVRHKVDAKGGLYSRGMAVLGTPGLLSKGNVYHVDSGHANASDNNEGTDPDRPLATIDAAIGKCTASNGDIILVSEGHAETITGAAGIALDIAGVTIAGLGKGSNRPTITFGTNNAASVDISAANTRITNLLFLNDKDGQTAMINVTADDVTIDTCEFREGTAKQPALYLNIGAANNDADRLKVYGCRFYAPTAGANSAIKLAQLQDSVELVGNVIYGDFADAGVHNPVGEVCTNLLIAENVVSNVNSGNHAIELVSACTGILAHNYLYADAATTILDPGSLKPMDNWGQHTIDAPAYKVPLAEVDVTTNPLGVNDADNAYDSGNVVANEDGSIQERLEQVQEAVNKGTGTSLPANTSLADFVGKGTATQLAANESLVDLLYGANGISTFPNAAVPANNVSLAEVLRDVWASLCGTAAGENGVQTFPAAAAPGNNVSLAEAIRYIVETQLGTIVNAGGTATVGGILGDFANDTLVARLNDIGSNVDGTTTDTIQGKLGTDTELADRSMFDILAGDGPAVFPAAAAPANDVSLAEVLRQVHDQTVGEWRFARSDWDFAADTGAAAAYTVFTVTGAVLLQVIPAVCETSVTAGGAVTIELGVAGNTAVFLAQIVDGRDLLANEIWLDATPTTTVEAIDLEGTKTFVVTNGQDVSFLIGVGGLTAGKINFFVRWMPLTAGATVVAA